MVVPLILHKRPSKRFEYIIKVQNIISFFKTLSESQDQKVNINQYQELKT